MRVLFLGLAILGGCATPATKPVSGLPPPAALAQIIASERVRPVFVLESTSAISEELDRRIGEWIEHEGSGDGVLEALESLRANAAMPVSLDSGAIVRAGGRFYSHSDTVPPSQPGTILGMIATGYSPDSTKAAILWNFGCGYLCGGIGISIFRRTDIGAWLQIRYISLGVS